MPSTGLYGAGSFGVALSAPLFCWPLQQSLFFEEESPGLSLGMKPSPGLAEAPLLLPGEASLGKGRHLEAESLYGKGCGRNLALRCLLSPTLAPLHCRHRS